MTVDFTGEIGQFFKLIDSNFLLRSNGLTNPNIRRGRRCFKPVTRNCLPESFENAIRKIRKIPLKHDFVGLQNGGLDIRKREKRYGCVFLLRNSDSVSRTI